MEPAPNKDKKKKILIAAGGIAAVFAAYMIYHQIMFVTTDNAQVQAHTVLLSPKVGGYIRKVNVEENQHVKAGDVLAEIDTRDFQFSLSSTGGEMESVEARLKDAERNYHRLSELFQSGAVSRQQADAAETNYRELTNRYKALKAQVAQASLNVEYTQLKAPSDGVIAKRSAEVGMLAAAGTPLFGFVSSESRWVVANFKETELRSIRIGNRVEIDVDAIPGRTFEGKVESISSATGSTFSLLPPDNATGNFTKVVQRVPVRVSLESLSPADIDLLRAGLSAYAKVHLH